MSYEPDMPVSSTAVAREKVNLPGIFLLIVGIINVLGALYFIFNGASGLLMKDKMKEDFRKGFEKGLKEDKKLTEEEKKQAAAIEGTMEQWLGAAPGINLAVGILGLIASVITILGAIKMRSLQSRGLAMTGAILAIIPCISPLGCCLVGEAIGIWALITLANADVKAAFR